MRRNKDVLVLGNDPYINEINFSRLDPGITTIGTNRIWLKFNPTYLFFHDIEILKELEKNQERLNDLKRNTTIIASDWLQERAKVMKYPLPAWITIYNRPDKYRFVDCVTTAIEIADRHLFRDKKNYYITGTSLTWKNPSHFWKVDQDQVFLNKRGQDWYVPRFNKTMNNFRYLQSKGIQLVSSTPDSKLNKLMRYEGIGRFYV